MALKKRKTQPAQRRSPVGPDRFTVERFMSNCTDATKKFLIHNWKEGNQLVARKVPVDGLPVVLIIAAYARDYDVELVDDYEALIQRYLDHVDQCWHPDKFMASCITILYERGLSPSDEAFEAVKIPELYEEFFP